MICVNDLDVDVGGKMSKVMNDMMIGVVGDNMENSLRLQRDINVLVR